VALTLTVLGASAAWSEHPGRPSSCYLVEIGTDAIVLDLGQGSLASVFGHRDPSSLQAVVISHLHGDHHVDLLPLRNLLRYGYAEPRSIGLHAPADLRHRYDVFTGEAGFLDSLVGPDLAEGILEIGPFRVQVQRVTHSEQSHAFRVTDASDSDAPGLVYSGDCGRADDLLPLIHAGDTLLCEAFWSIVEPVPDANHLSAYQAADVARRGGAAHLILTHVLESHDPQAGLKAARRIFPGSVELAEPELVVSMGHVR
jgi:ribonuclease BN (tRNA processing enzyme)